MAILEDTTPPVPLLKIQGLCKDFSSGSLWGTRIRVIDDINMAVQAGEIRGIVGESGSGKTTLARCSLRLIEPTAGSVQFDGEDLACLSAAALRARRKNFQMIFQDAFASLNPEMTVGQILTEPLAIHNAGDKESRKERIRELLDSVSLSASLIDRPPGELSGGQQQRLGIARGLALKPRLLIADEPVSALDASVAAQILNLLGDVKKRYDLTLVLISHSLHVIHYLCTDISVLYRGRLVEEAPAAAFFKGPKHPYSRMLLEAMPALEPCAVTAFAAGPGTELPAAETSAGCAFYGHCPHRLPVCKERVPHLAEIHPGERVACYLYSDSQVPIPDSRSLKTGEPESIVGN